MVSKAVENNRLPDDLLDAPMNGMAPSTGIRRATAAPLVRGLELAQVND